MDPKRKRLPLSTFDAALEFSPQPKEATEGYDYMAVLGRRKEEATPKPTPNPNPKKMSTEDTASKTPKANPRKDCFDFLSSVVANPDQGVDGHQKFLKAQLGTCSFDRAKRIMNEVLAQGMVEQYEFKTGSKPREALRLTDKGRQFLNTYEKS